MYTKIKQLSMHLFLNVKSQRLCPGPTLQAYIRLESLTLGTKNMQKLAIYAIATLNQQQFSYADRQ